MTDTFSKMHPFVNLLFFIGCIGFSMFIMQPVCLVISLLCAAFSAAYFCGKKAALFGVKFLLPTMLFIILINPLFNHRGATIICYLPWGNPFTLESLVYGCVTAAMLCAVALWFLSFNRVMTSDKLVYLFGRIAPSLSLVLAMALRFVPRFTQQFREVRIAQKQLYSGKKSLSAKLRSAFGVFSVMISRSMENAIDTSDAMKSRGYGLKGRTAYSLYRFRQNDGVVLGAMVSELACLFVILFCGKISYRYFPSIRGEITDVFSIVFYAVYALFLLTPLIINVREGIRWKRSRSII